MHSFWKFVSKWDGYGHSKSGKSNGDLASPDQLYVRVSLWSRSWGASEAWQAPWCAAIILKAVDSPTTTIVQRPWFSPSHHLASALCCCKARTFNLATLPPWPRTSPLEAYAYPQPDTGHLLSHVDKEERTHECSDKSRVLAWRYAYQVPDVVFPKHGPTFCPRLWASTMLLRGGTRGSTVRGNVVIYQWHCTTTMGHCQVISTSQSVALEDHQYDWPTDLPPKSEILSEIDYPVPFRSSALTKTKDCFQTQTRQLVFSAGK